MQRSDYILSMNNKPRDILSKNFKYCQASWSILGDVSSNEDVVKQRDVVCWSLTRFTMAVLKLLLGAMFELHLVSSPSCNLMNLDLLGDTII